MLEIYRNFEFQLQVEQRTSEIYSFLTQAAPFGTMLDTTVHSVIDKMSNKSSPIPKTQKVIIVTITNYDLINAVAYTPLTLYALLGSSIWFGTLKLV